MSSVFRFLVKSLKVCCPAEYIRLTRTEHAQSLADFLGVHKRTIYSWRLAVKRGKAKCEHCPNCPRRPDAIPIALPRQRRKHQPPKTDS
jgi:hypothetical protein